MRPIAVDIEVSVAANGRNENTLDKSNHNASSAEAFRFESFLTRVCHNAQS